MTRGDTVTFRLTKPAPLFLLELSNLYPVPPGTPSREAQTKPVPGTGTYLIESNVPGRQAKLARNPHFRVWSVAARPAAYPDEIVFRNVPTAQGVRDVAQGDADVLLELLPPDDFEDVQLQSLRQLHILSLWWTMFLFLDTTRPPFSDARVRRAVNYAVDRGRLAELGGGSTFRQPTCQVIPPAVPGYVRYCRTRSTRGRRGSGLRRTLTRRSS